MSAVLDIPQCNMSLTTGDIVKLSKYSDITWMVGYGWYSVNSLPPTCGWYLMRCDKPGTFKALESNDLNELVIEVKRGQ